MIESFFIDSCAIMVCKCGNAYENAQRAFQSNEIVKEIPRCITIHNPCIAIGK
jgi:hypothetical protein